MISTQQHDSGENKFHDTQVTEALLQALEAGRRGVQICRVAMFAAPDGAMREEWRRIVAEAKAYEQVLLGVFEHLELDADATSPGRTLVNHQGESLLKALEVGLNSATPVGAQSIARECIAIAHNQVLLSWYSIGSMATEVAGSTGKALQVAFAEVEEMRAVSSRRH